MEMAWHVNVGNSNESEEQVSRLKLLDVVC